MTNQLDNSINVANTSGAEVVSMKEILAQYEPLFPRLGEVLSGTVISATHNSILVDLGTLGTGIIYPSEFYDNPGLLKTLAPSETIPVILLDVEDENGYRVLSLKRAQITSAWESIYQKKESGEIIAVTIMNINKGGLIVELHGIQGFLPLSQLAPAHYPKIQGGDTTQIVQTLQKFRGQVFNIKIIDCSEEEGKLIVSERATLNDQLKAELSKFTLDQVVEGEITDITEFGAFIRLTDDLEGLIHISEIDWKLVENPRDYLKVGQKVTAKIISLDNDRVSLSLKALQPDPWEGIETKFTVGQSISGEIIKITNYGILIQVSEQIMGLVPAAELKERKEWSPALGEVVKAAIVSIDSKEHKMLLTLEGSAAPAVSA